MHKHDEPLFQLIEIARTQGFLTYTQVTNYLPDEALNPEKLDTLLLCLEELELDVLTEREAGLPEPEMKKKPLKKPKELTGEDASRKIDDPVRMYLTQMGEIPLLTREQEIFLAKKIEITRKRFRRALL